MLAIERDVFEIERFDPQGKPALSAYLGVGAPNGSSGAFEARLAAVLRPIADRLDGAQARALEAAAGVARAGVEALEPRPRAVAVFSCPDARFVKVVPLPSVVEPMARWGPRLYISPLSEALEEHERTAVILVDKDRGRVFRLFMGSIEEVAKIDESAGPANAHEWHVRRLLELILQALRREDMSATDRILLGGSQETVHELLRLMPKRLRDRTRLIAGIPVSAATQDVLTRITDLQRQDEREREEELLDQLIDCDRAHAVFGAAGVLEAVAEARVHTLVYGTSSWLEGSECSDCGWLMVGSVAGCPKCGRTMDRLPDLAERAVSRVLQAGGRVEELRGPALRTLGGLGGIAALLRYAPGATAA